MALITVYCGLSSILGRLLVMYHSVNLAQLHRSDVISAWCLSYNMLRYQLGSFISENTVKLAVQIFIVSSLEIMR